MNPFFSVVIITKNEEHYIGKILTALTNQTFKDFEVIVVDADSTDKTQNIVNSYKTKFPLTLKIAKIRNLSASRNIGAASAKGKYYFFIDGDNSIPNNFLAKVHQYIQKNNSNVIIPSISPTSNTFIDNFLFKTAFFLILLMSFTPRPFSTGSSMIISREYFKKVNGFDPTVEIAEDQDMIRRLKKSGAKLFLMGQPAIIFSTRRFEEQTIKAYSQYIYSTLYLLIFSKINKKIYTYEMGGDNFSKK